MSDDLVGDVHRLLLIVRHDDGRGVRLVVEASQPFPELRPDAGVQCTEGLVEEQHGRVDREGAGEPHALPLSARELRRVTLGEALELHELQELPDALGDLRLGALTDLQAEGDVVVDRHVLEGGVVLEDEADTTLLWPPYGDVLPVDEDAAELGRLEPGDDPQQCGLAAAARPEECRERSRGDLHRYVVERDVLVEPLRDATDGDRHQRLLSFGWRKIIAIRMMIAVAASTKEMP